jgi:ketosteroid isomerase-like protein
MSQRNVELVLESVRRFRPGGLDEWAELWHPDTRMVAPEGWPEPGPFIGLDASRRQFERLLDSFPAFDVDQDVEIVAASGDWVVANFRIPVRGASSGLASELQVAAAYRVEDGLLIEFVARWHVDDALDAAGLSR